MITGLAKMLSRGILKGISGVSHAALKGGYYAGKGAAHAGAFAGKVPWWYARQFGKMDLEDKLANIGLLGMVYKRNKSRWHDALHAGELIHPYNY